MLWLRLETHVAKTACMWPAIIFAYFFSSLRRLAIRLIFSCAYTGLSRFLENIASNLLRLQTTLNLSSVLLIAPLLPLILSANARV